MSATAERYSRISCSVTDVCTINANIGINGSIIIWKWIRMSMSEFLLTVGEVFQEIELFSRLQLN